MRRHWKEIDPETWHEDDPGRFGAMGDGELLQTLRGAGWDGSDELRALLWEIDSRHLAPEGSGIARVVANHRDALGKLDEDAAGVGGI